MGPGLPHGSSPWAEGPRDDNPKGSRLGARDMSNSSSHITCWSAVVATGPYYLVMITYLAKIYARGLNPHSRAAIDLVGGEAQATMVFMILLTPIVLIAAFRSLVLWAGGKWTRID